MIVPEFTPEAPHLFEDHNLVLYFRVDSNERLVRTRHSRGIVDKSVMLLLKLYPSPISIKHYKVSNDVRV